MTHDSDHLCISIPPKVTRPFIQTAEAFSLQPRSVSVITVQAQTKEKLQCIYELNMSNDLLDGLTPLAVDHKIDHKYPKQLNIPVLITS